MHAKEADIFGNADLEGEEKQLRRLDERGIAIELAAPFRANAQSDEFSRLRVHIHGHKVFEVRWDKTGRFKAVTFEPGDWERTLRGWLAPIPFE